MTGLRETTVRTTARAAALAVAAALARKGWAVSILEETPTTWLVTGLKLAA